jgi:hypothetical protein
LVEAEKPAQLQYQVGGHPTPIADVVSDCCPRAWKFQRFSYGLAFALSAGELAWQISLTRENTIPDVQIGIAVEPSGKSAGQRFKDPGIRFAPPAAASYVGSSTLHGGRTSRGSPKRNGQPQRLRVRSRSFAPRDSALERHASRIRSAGSTFVKAKGRSNEYDSTSE